MSSACSQRAPALCDRRSAGLLAVLGLGVLTGLSKFEHPVDLVSVRVPPRHLQVAFRRLEHERRGRVQRPRGLARPEHDQSGRAGRGQHRLLHRDGLPSQGPIHQQLHHGPRRTRVGGFPLFGRRVSNGHTCRGACLSPAGPPTRQEAHHLMERPEAVQTKAISTFRRHRVLSAQLRCGVGGELVERHGPSCGAVRVAGYADMGHDQSGVAVDVVQLNLDFGRGGMCLGQARIRGR